MKKWMAWIGLLALTAGMLAGCREDVPVEKSGSVYYLNAQPQADEAWQELAAAYTAKTGVTVRVVTLAEDTDTLAEEMEKEDAPTLFQGSREEVDAAYAGSFDGTPVMEELTTDALTLRNAQGQTVFLGYGYTAFGIIVNKTLLEQAGHSVEEIRDFTSLKTVADDIHARSGELGFDAFTSCGLDSSSSWRFSAQLANLPLFYEFRDGGITEQPATIAGSYLDAYRRLWDLYTTDTAKTGVSLITASQEQAQAEFGEGKAAFFPNGSWEYETLTKSYSMKGEELEMLPLYGGVPGEEKAGLCCDTERYWGISAKASEEDKQATLAFLLWVVTSEEGTTMLAEQFGACPFRMAKEPSNVFLAQANRRIAAGDYVLTWAYRLTPAADKWRAELVNALTQYTLSGSSDWSDVQKALVQGWENGYAEENG